MRRDVVYQFSSESIWPDLSLLMQFIGLLSGVQFVVYVGVVEYEGAP